MRYVAAYLLAVLGGNASPSNADLEKILSSVGIEVDAARVTKIIGELKGKSIDELIAQGREKLSSMPTGGGAVAAAPAAGKFSTLMKLWDHQFKQNVNQFLGAAPAAAVEKKEEKKKVESESEEDDDMGFGLFE